MPPDTTLRLMYAVVCAMLAAPLGACANGALDDEALSSVAKGDEIPKEQRPGFVDTDAEPLGPEAGSARPDAGAQAATPPPQGATDPDAGAPVAPAADTGTGAEPPPPPPLPQPDPGCPEAAALVGHYEGRFVDAKTPAINGSLRFDLGDDLKVGASVIVGVTVEGYSFEASIAGGLACRELEASFTGTVSAYGLSLSLSGSIDGTYEDGGFNGIFTARGPGGAIVARGPWSATH